MSSVSDRGLQERLLHGIRAPLEHHIDHLPHVGGQGRGGVSAKHVQVGDRDGGLRHQLLVEECGEVPQPEERRVGEPGLGGLQQVLEVLNPEILLDSLTQS